VQQVISAGIFDNSTCRFTEAAQFSTAEASTLRMNLSPSPAISVPRKCATVRRFERQHYHYVL